MQPTPCVLGIDLGTSAIKLVAVSRDGHVLASARGSYDTISTAEGQAEQDCQHWLRALSVAAKKIGLSLAHKARVAGIALTGQMPTLVALSGQQPVGRAITWQDSRANGWVSQRVDKDLRLDIYRRTGVPIDGRYLGPMFQHRHGPKQKAHTILSAKDFLFHALTGLTVTDPSTASGYGLYNLHLKTWDQDLSKFWGITKERLPSIESSSFRAPLNQRGRQLLGCALGTPVILGCADSVAGAYALSGDQQPPETATILTGTSTVIMRCDSQPRWDRKSRYLLTPFAVDGLYGCEADLLATGSAREWAAGVFVQRGEGKRRRSLWQSAYEIAPGAHGLLFAPFLAGGEEGVLWNSSLRGALTGLTLAHSKAEIARALLEGMLFEIRRCLEVFQEEVPLSLVRVAGWIADIPQELQMLADIIGRPAHAFRLPSAPAIGATLLTGLVDSKKYFANTKPAVYTPGQPSKRYNQIYARYVAHFPAAATSGPPPQSRTGHSPLGE
jgi:xylulokinase